MLKSERIIIAIVLLILAACLPISDFYIANLYEAPPLSKIQSYFVTILSIELLLLLLMRLVFFKIASWRLAVAIFIGSFAFFSYYHFEPLIGHFRGRPTLHQGFVVAYVITTCLLIIGLAILVNRLQVLWACLLMSLLFLLTNAIRATSYQPSHSEIISSQAVGTKTISNKQILPNVYWIILDSYPNQIELKRFFAFDNFSFLAQLRQYGFQIMPNSMSNHISSIYSVTTTLSMNYLISDKSTKEQAQDLRHLRHILRGGSEVVQRFRDMGYQYIHFSNGYDSMTLCDSQPDKCVSGNTGLDEYDSAFFKRTPMIDYLILKDRGSVNDGSSAFNWGGVDELHRSLNQILNTKNPYFVYAHIDSPHPPIRFKADCKRFPFVPDLQTWNVEQKSAFVEQLQCENSRTLGFVADLLRQDPQAIIILQGDHGTAFSKQQSTSPEKWTREQFLERFSVLNAMRMPRACIDQLPADLSLVNTFNVVFACLAGKSVSQLPNRHFISMYDDQPGFGNIIEYLPNSR